MNKVWFWFVQKVYMDASTWWIDKMEILRTFILEKHFCVKSIFVVNKFRQVEENFILQRGM